MKNKRTNTPVHKLEQFFRDIIKRMDEKFTFHDFVLKLARLHQQEYISALVYFKQKKYPFCNLHAELERRLHNGSYGLNLINSKKRSQNIFGVHSQCGEWEKKAI